MPSMVPGSTKRNGMQHLNNDIMCVIDVETTGNKPGHDDMWQICILPLDASLHARKDVLPFYFDLQLRRPWNLDLESRVYRKNREGISKAQLSGIDPDRALDLFDEWFQRLALPFRKRIIPLAQNWPFDRGFLIDWMGHEAFEQYFSPVYRDTLSASAFCNDRADHYNEKVPFSKHNLAWLCRVFGVENPKAHDALQDCLTTAAIYREMCKVFTFPKVQEAPPEPDEEEV